MEAISSFLGLSSPSPKRKVKPDNLEKETFPKEEGKSATTNDSAKSKVQKNNVRKSSNPKSGGKAAEKSSNAAGKKYSKANSYDGGKKQSQQKDTSSDYTTVMLRNIPNKYTREMLVEEIDKNFKGKYTFLFLPTDFVNGANPGYCFLDFTTNEERQNFENMFDGASVKDVLPAFKSQKVCEVSRAKLQGTDDNVRNLRSSDDLMRRLSTRPHCTPLIYDKEGNPVQFETPDPTAEDEEETARVSRRGRRSANSSSLKRNSRSTDRSQEGSGSPKSAGNKESNKGKSKGQNQGGQRKEQQWTQNGYSYYNKQQNWDSGYGYNKWQGYNQNQWSKGQGYNNQQRGYNNDWNKGKQNYAQSDYKNYKQNEWNSHPQQWSKGSKNNNWDTSNYKQNDWNQKSQQRNYNNKNDNYDQKNQNNLWKQQQNKWKQPRNRDEEKSEPQTIRLSDENESENQPVDLELAYRSALRDWISSRVTTAAAYGLDPNAQEWQSGLTYMDPTWQHNQFQIEQMQMEEQAQQQAAWY